MKVIAYKDPETGALVVVHPTPEYVALCLADEENHSLMKLAEQVIPKGVPFVIMDADAVPEDRYFRNAWDLDDTEITVNLEKAREIQMDNIRRARDEKIKELDLETLKGNDVQKEKQRLRDLPQTIDLSAAKTLDELKSIWPDGLKKAIADEDRN